VWIRAFAWLAAFGLWAGCVHSYWRSEVPLIPIEVIPDDAEWQTAPFGSARLLSNGHVVQSLVKLIGHDFIWSGPVRVWDPLLHRVDYELLDRASLIQGIDVLNSRVIAIEFDKTLLVLDGLSGQTKMRLTLNRELPSLSISPDSRLLVAAAEDGQVEVYEIETGNRVFIGSSPPGSSWPMFVGADVLRERFDRAWDTHTWKRAPVPNLLVEPEAVSDDGRWGIVKRYDFYWLHDMLQDKSLWPFKEWDVTARVGFHFLPNVGDVIAIEARSPIRIVRHSIEDGRVLSDVRLPNQELSVVSPPTPDGRYVLCETPPDKRPVVEWVNRMAGKLRLGPLPVSEQGKASVVAADLVTGQIGPLIAMNLNQSFSLPELGFSSTFPRDYAFSASVVAFKGDEGTYLWRYPFQRRWSWLVGWTLGPFLAIGLIRAIGSRWRSRAGRRLQDLAV
jgi:hypothetical protein